MAQVRYSKLSTDDDATDASSAAAGAGASGGALNEHGRTKTQQRARRERRRAAKRSDKRKTEWANYFSEKMHAAMWVAGMCGVLYWCDAYNVVAKHPDVRRGWLYFAIVCWSVVVVIILYLSVWIPHVRKIHYEPNVVAPRAIPTAAVFMVSGSLSFVFAFWPVWGWLTPFILGITGLGLLMSFHFLPAIPPPARPAAD